MTFGHFILLKTFWHQLGCSNINCPANAGSVRAAHVQHLAGSTQMHPIIKNPNSSDGCFSRNLPGTACTLINRLDRGLLALACELSEQDLKAPNTGCSFKLLESEGHLSLTDIFFLTKNNTSLQNT